MIGRAFKWEQNKLVQRKINRKCLKWEMKRLQTVLCLSNQRNINPLSHPFKYHPSHSTTQLEFIISPTHKPMPAGCVSDPVWGSSPAADLRLTSALPFNLSGMTQVLRNFSAPCLKQPVESPSPGRTRSPVTTQLCCVIWPANAKLWP